MKANKPRTLQDKISAATKGLKCPVHDKEAKIIVDMKEMDVKIEGCCIYFKKDISVIVDRVIAAWNLHGEHLRAKKDGFDDRGR